MFQCAFCSFISKCINYATPESKTRNALVMLIIVTLRYRDAPIWTLGDWQQHLRCVGLHKIGFLGIIVLCAVWNIGWTGNALVGNWSVFVILDGQNWKTWIVGAWAHNMVSFSIWRRQLMHQMRLHLPPLPSRSGHCLCSSLRPSPPVLLFSPPPSSLCPIASSWVPFPRTRICWQSPGRFHKPDMCICNRRNHH